MPLDLFDRWTVWLLPRLADHLWQSTLIGLSAFVVVYLLHRQSARLRHVLLLLAMAKFLVPSALLVASLDLLGITLVGLFPSPSATTVSYLQPSLWLQLDEQEPVAHMTASLDKWSGVYLALVSTWLLGCLLLTMMWLRRRRLVKALLAGTTRVSVGREADFVAPGFWLDALQETCGAGSALWIHGAGSLGYTHASAAAPAGNDKRNDECGTRVGYFA